MGRLFDKVQLIVPPALGFFLLYLLSHLPPPTAAHLVLRVWGAYLTLAWIVLTLLRKQIWKAVLISTVLYLAGIGPTEIALVATIPAIIAVFWYLIFGPLWWAYKCEKFRGLVKALGGIIGGNITAFGFQFSIGTALPPENLQLLGDEPTRTAASYIRYAVLAAAFFLTYRYLVKCRD
ncbi:hypothetical protein Pogu_0815 [Pyrobaculum oguniense TE7]|uniref:Uncharacterized protein n=1 Tax=Pyrobaculum oguniense (strain DSM 13380 / JCM 10595 / TE7) TaxID=698757 RepID=H6Q9K8_PYROT|nr:hypothetical protein Pogu_0815 [Pyrobaculum oguniense TE7]